MKVKRTKECPPHADAVPENPDNWWVRGTADTMKFFGVSAETLSSWEKRGAPKIGYGKWDVKMLIEWKYGASDGNKSPAARKLAAEANWKEAKAGQEAIKLAVAEGKYVATDNVTADLRRLFGVLRKSLLAIGHNIAIEVNSFEPEVALVAKRKVDDAIHEALRQLAEAGEIRQEK